MRKTVDLQKYVELKKRELAKFEQHYSSKAIRNPQDYPTELPNADEWDEQFYAWRDLSNKEKSE